MSSNLDSLEKRMSVLENSLNELKDMMKRSYCDKTDGVHTKTEARAKEIPESDLRKIENIMDNFDFYKVQKTMKLLQWEWASKGVPDVKDIKEEAYRLLVDAAYEKTTIATGGLRATYDSDGGEDTYISLEFIIEDCEGFDE